jgi:diguanylate cyclase (GGDEF)-like protein
MENHSGVDAATIMNKSLFDTFPDLPKAWLTHKLETAFFLKSRSFTVWEQRPWVFPFANPRPITGGSEMMMQNMTIQPLANMSGEICHAALVVFDASVQAEDREQLQNANNQLAHLSQIDPLTGLANRRQWKKALKNEYDRCRRYQPPSSLLVIDIDHFKSINDRFGHAIGDKVLLELGKLLKNLLRKTDVVSRYGGEEFAILLTETNGTKGLALAERLRTAIEQLQIRVPESISITASIGVCAFEHGLNSPNEWFEKADRALYDAKKSGRNRVAKA